MVGVDNVPKIDVGVGDLRKNANLLEVGVGDVLKMAKPLKVGVGTVYFPMVTCTALVITFIPKPRVYHVCIVFVLRGTVCDRRTRGKRGLSNRPS